MDDNDLRKQIQKAEELSKLLNNTGKEPLQSNEEWFDGLSVEEKAKVIVDMIEEYIQWEYGINMSELSKETQREYIEKWLKETHK